MPVCPAVFRGMPEVCHRIRPNTKQFVSFHILVSFRQRLIYSLISSKRNHCSFSTEHLKSCYRQRSSHAM